jgi:hypothetical protein
MAGRLQLEGDNGEILLGRGPSPTIVFTRTSPQDALSLANSFDLERFVALVRSTVHERAPQAEPSLENVAVYLGNDGNDFFIKYEVYRWGRYRLDLGRLRYRLDLTDPVAQSYNAAIDDAFAKAGLCIVDGNGHDVAREQKL